MISEARRAAPQEHLCWAYEDLGSLAARAERYLLAGLAAGERVWYVTPHPADAVADRLHRLPGFAAR